MLLLMVSSAVAQPTPQTDESVEAYINRYAEWLETIPEDERAWEEMGRVDQELKDALNGNRLIDDPEEDGWAESLQFVRDHQPLVDRTRRYAQLQYLGMPVHDLYSEEEGLDFDVPPAWNIRLPHLGMIWRGAKLLRIDTVRAGMENDHATALQNLEAIYGLQQKAPLVHSLLESLVELAVSYLHIAPVINGRVVIENSTQQELEQLSKMYNHPPLSIEHRDAALFEQWTSMQILNWFYSDTKSEKLTIPGVKRLLDYAGGEDVLDDAIKEQDSLPFGPDVKQIAKNATYIWARDMLKPRSEQREFLKKYWVLLYEDIVIKPHLIRSFRHEEAFVNLSREEGMRFMPAAGVVAAGVLGDYRRYYDRSIQGTIPFRVTQLIISLHQHKLRVGSFPSSLDSLNSDLERQLLVDPYSGQSIVYKLVDGQPLIYSLGPDRDDDNGKPILDEEGNVNYWPDFLTLDELDALDDDERAEIDGDWILYPMIP